MKPVGGERQSTFHWPTGKFFYLFLCQVLFLVLFPYFDQPGLPMILFRLLVAATFVSAVYAVSERRAQWLTALVFAIPAGVLNTLFALHAVPRIVVPTLVFTLLFLAYTAVSLLRAVLRSTAVTPDTIYRCLERLLPDGHHLGSGLLPPYEFTARSHLHGPCAPPQSPDGLVRLYLLQLRDAYHGGLRRHGSDHTTGAFALHPGGRKRHHVCCSTHCPPGRSQRCR